MLTFGNFSLAIIDFNFGWFLKNIAEMSTLPSHCIPISPGHIPRGLKDCSVRRARQPLHCLLRRHIYRWLGTHNESKMDKTGRCLGAKRAKMSIDRDGLMPAGGCVANSRLSAGDHWVLGLDGENVPYFSIFRRSLGGSQLTFRFSANLLVASSDKRQIGFQ